jgi:O-antigen/teichoic acid export membrane protein
MLRTFLVFFIGDVVGSVLVVVLSALAWWLFGGVAAIVTSVVSFTLFCIALYLLVKRALDREFEEESNL